jgi:2-iminobutanoate/2-iminopropanoate deaminase
MVNRKELINSTEGTHKHKSPIPLGIKAGGFIFLSALRGVNPKTRSIDKDDMEGQARQLFENLKNALSVSGATLNDVVKMGVYVVDLNDRGAFNKVWTEYFGHDTAARFMVQVADLGVPEDKTRVLVEVTALAPGT